MATLRQLEYFVTVVDEGSFTRAAEKLHVSQPGLSHQFLALERSVGGPLVERVPRALRLTVIGRAMLPHARAALAEAERATSAARNAAGVASGELHLATLYSLSVGLLPAVLRVWRRQHPNVRVRLVEFRHTDDLVAAMLAGRADLAVGPPPPEWEGAVHPIGTDEFVVVVAADDPQPDGPLDLRDLAGREWVHFTPGSGLADLLDQACAAAGFRPRVAVRTEQGPSAAQLAAAGLGPTLVPANILSPHFEARVLRPDPPVGRPIVAYSRSAVDPVVAAFVDALMHSTYG